MGFYTVIVIIAACFLIFCLIVVGIIMNNSTNLLPFPPVQSPCPDNWIVNKGNCLIGNTNIGTISNNISSFTQNTYGIYDSSTGYKGTSILNPLNGSTTINFKDSNWANAGSTACGQKKWSNQFGISWDGISNSTGC
jgi:hypothetical protein